MSAAAAAAGDAVPAVRSLMELRAEGERISAWIDLFVVLARRAGASWATIGEALGVSKQAAHSRYGAAADAALRDAIRPDARAWADGSVEEPLEGLG